MKSKVNPLITRDITYLLSGVSHQVILEFSAINMNTNHVHSKLVYFICVDHQRLTLFALWSSDIGIE